MQTAGLLRTITIGALIFAIFSFSSVSYGKDPSKSNHYRYQGGVITIKGDALPLLQTLQKISKSAGIRIIVLDSVEPQSIRIEMVKAPFEKVIQSILKGHNYAVLYPQNTSWSGVQVMGHGGAGRFENRNEVEVADGGPGAWVGRLTQDESIAAKQLRKYLDKAVMKQSEPEEENSTDESLTPGK